MKQVSLRKKIALFEAKLNNYIPEIDVDLTDEIARLESSFHEFIKAAWHLVEGNEQYRDGWHIKAIAEHLEGCFYGTIKTLLINIPPRFSKTLITCVLWPAWCWAKKPTLKFLCASYSRELSVESNNTFRRLINSSWYKKRWGDKFRLDKEIETKIYNNRLGSRHAVGIGSIVTGLGGNINILDDPNNMDEVFSESIRDRTNRWVDSSFYSRANNIHTVCRIYIQQRGHHKDVSGYLLAKNNSEQLVHLCLPLAYEMSRKCVTVPIKSTNGLPWQDPRTEEGQALWPEYFDEKKIASEKDRLLPYDYAGQYQQRPSPEQGSIFMRHWFQMWKQPSPPRCHFILQSWDTAFSGEPTKGGKANVSYSACTTWGVFTHEGNDHAILLDTWRARVEYPELRQMAQRLSVNYHDTDIDNPWPESRSFVPDVILIEAKASGLTLIPDLRRAGVMVDRFDPNRYGNKVARARNISHIFQCGRVWLPGQPPHYDVFRAYAEQFVEHCLFFPSDESNDIMDSTSQAFIRLLSSGYIQHKDDEVLLPMHDYSKLAYSTSTHYAHLLNAPSA